jgi:lipase chaperone LimK
MKKFKLSAEAPTTYQLQSVRAFGSPIKSNMNGSHTFEGIFDSEEKAKEYLIKRAEIYYEQNGTDEELQEAINDINKYGSVRFDAVSGGIEEIEIED